MMGVSPPLNLHELASCSTAAEAMETLLARELQQACLETLVRKQTSEPPPISSAHGHSPFSLPPSSGSSAPSDPGAGIPSPQPDDLESLHDPVHQAISDILMEEDIDERPCMYAECVSYMKSLYDIIGSNEASVCPDTDEAGLVQNDCSGPFGFEGERSVVTEGDGAFRGFSASFDDKELDAVNYLLHGESSAVEDEGSGVYTQTHGMEPSNYLIQTEQFLNVPSYEAENVLISTSSEQFDYLINNNVNAIRLPQGVSAGAVLSPAASVSSYNGFPRADLSVQHQAGNAAFDWQDPVIDMISLSSSSAVTEVAPYIQARYHDTQFVSNGGDQDNITTGSNERVAILSRVRATNRLRSETFQKLPRRKTSLGVESWSKRSTTEVESDAASQSVDDVLSATSCVATEYMEEESVSYVQNEHLKAEMCASVLSNGINSVKVDCCKSSTKSVKEDVGRSTIVVATVADLKGLLISCAQAVASNNLRRAQEVLQEIRQDASPYGSALQRLAHYFAEGLVARISGTGDRLYSVFSNNRPSAAKLLRAHQVIVQKCPFVRLSHYFANKTILEAAKGASRLHIIDYGILYGWQWPCLISALAARENGPPVLRITGIDFPQPGYARAERLKLTGKRLEEYAKHYRVPFEYVPVADRWEDIQPSSLNLRQDEVIVVNSIYRMQNLLDETVLASNPRNTVLSKIKEINPKVFVHGVKNGNYNAPFFMSRFKEALAAFSGGYDMLETLIEPENQERMMLERELWGRDILNVVACEGPERIERPETYRQWQNRTKKAGFVQLPADRGILRDCQTVVKRHYNKNFTVDEDGSWMLLSWKGKVVLGLSLWKPARKL